MTAVEESHSELDFEVPPQTAAVVNSLSEKIHVSRSEVLSMGLALLKLAVEAGEKGQRLVVTDGGGKPVTEITLFPLGATLMADPDMDDLTKAVVTAFSKMLPFAEKPSKAETTAKIERERLDAEHRRRQDQTILRAAVGFTSAVSLVCVAAVFSPWSTDQTRTWATATLTAVATSFGGYWAGKQSIK